VPTASAGVVLVPLLTLAFHVDLRYAIGASLIGDCDLVARLRMCEGYSNVRIGMFLSCDDAGRSAGSWLRVRPVLWRDLQTVLICSAPPAGRSGSKETSRGRTGSTASSSGKTSGKGITTHDRIPAS
jgi:hypothetical protein